MDQNSIDRIRSATFPISRKGYETREVERFLTRIADWLETGGEDEARADLVRRELERVGQKTSSILASAEDSAEQLRAEAEQEAEETLDGARRQALVARNDAEEYSKQTREEADEYAARVRQAADMYSDQTRGAANEDAEETRVEAERQAGETTSAAEQRARRTVAEGEKRRKDIEAVISDLTARRDELIAEVNRLVDELRAATAVYAPEGAGDSSAIQGEPGPPERETQRLEA